jgi:hypothetical protein|nr:MAG TPA: hypothetical protein [Caudoviricetes sp.]
MCENGIIAFGMNGMEIALTLAVIASLFGLVVFMFMYLNGHILHQPEVKMTGGTLTRAQISELHSHMVRKG